ncbi:MAG: hypothetical protein HDS38_05900 [Bacteroides sp.]|nr:hypothetical protein [Bacteroides sp.]
MKRFYLMLLSCIALSSYVSAQIGYQVSLLNNATGEPRANERVTVTVKITDSEGKTVCDETKNETSNDFGVISMSVGDSDTFANADWSKLPFFIEASVDGRLLGKSQLLSVSVAEHANHTGSLTADILCSKEWIHRYSNGEYDGHFSYKFNRDGTCLFTKSNSSGTHVSYHESYFIDGNDVIIYGHYSDDTGEDVGEENSTIYKYSPYLKKLFHSYGSVFK